MFLLTDYGQRDELAGVLRAVIARCAPEAQIVDLTHDVPAFDVRAGALALRRAVPFLGPGVVVAVVDPGVGGGRRAVALELPTPQDDAPVTHCPRPRHLVGPDNGLLSWAAQDMGGVSRAVELSGATERSEGLTFDGRDLFAPAAAAIWRGVALGELGHFVDPAGLVRLADPVVSVTPGKIETEVLWVDAFGNVQLSAGPQDATTAGLAGKGEQVEVLCGGSRVWARRVTTFSSVPEGEMGLIVDSNGHLALVRDRSSAAATLGAVPGQRVTLSRGAS